MSDNSLYRIYENTPFSPKYRLKRLLGEGSFGAVFLADEVIADQVMRQVALKAIRIQPQWSESRIVGELQLATTLEHPHILRCHTAEAGELCHPGLGTDRGVRCLGLVMEVGTQTLTTYWNNAQQQLSPEQVCEIMLDIVGGLKYLHNRSESIVHQDLKPDNILQVNGVWKIADLGAARYLGFESVRYTNPIGTIEYAAPEVLERRAVSPAWDVWSVGVMMVELLTGQHPFVDPGDRIETIQRRLLTKAPQINGNIPAPLLEVIEGCLLKDRRQRWTAARVYEKIAEQAPGSVSFPSRPAQREKELSLDLGQGVSLELVAIPGGTFVMGLPDGYCYPLEGRRHQAKIHQSFWMGKYPVTQAQWRVVATLPRIDIDLNANPSKSIDRPRPQFVGDERPAIFVNWYEALEFCKRISQLTDQTYNLPSEVEWEYACRAGNRGLYCFGDNEQQLEDYAWYGKNSNGGPRSVGQKRANTFGLYDMHGNVQEWCQGYWPQSSKGLLPPEANALEIDSKKKYVRVRSGSWFQSSPLNFLSGRQSIKKPDQRDCHTGFRVICYTPHSF